MSLEEAIARALPSNYNFEIHKTVRRIREDNAKSVALQFPEGLLLFATAIADILRHFAAADRDLDIAILGDVTYGACCIDDLTSEALGIELLVHYGHSCLVPISETTVPCLYVFVDIYFDPWHLVECIRTNFPPKGELPAPLPEETASPPPSEDANSAPPRRRAEGAVAEPLAYSGVPRVALLGTIQYSSAMHTARKLLESGGTDEDRPRSSIPQVPPLTPGEVLGCTSPVLKTRPTAAAGGGCGKESPAETESPAVDLCVFVADGRFHLESAMIQNPSLPFYRYDPFTKVLFREWYDFEKFLGNRRSAIAAGRRAKRIGLILGTLGRQGSVGVLERIEALLAVAGVEAVTLLMSELLPPLLEEMQWADVFVQVACPRLSIDWGQFYAKPLLTPFEAHVAWGDAKLADVYPMDFYGKSGAVWTNYHEGGRMGSLARGDEAARRKALLRSRLAARRARKIENADRSPPVVPDQ